MLQEIPDDVYRTTFDIVVSTKSEIRMEKKAGKQKYDLTDCY